MADSQPIRLSTAELASGDRVSVFAAALHRTPSGVVFAGGHGRIVKITTHGTKTSALAELTHVEAARLARVLTAEPAHLRYRDERDYDLATGQDVMAGAVVGRVLADPAGGLVVRWVDGGRVVDEDYPDTAAEAVALIAARGYALDSESAAALRGATS